MNSQQLFSRSRLRLAAWYALVTGGILSLLGVGMAQTLVQANWSALEREIESSAGTLHDSLEPMLPPAQNPTGVLKQIFPDLCLVRQPCEDNPSLIQRHTIGISDRSTYYIRLFDNQGNLLAYSPNQPKFISSKLNPDTWQTLKTPNGSRYHQFTTILHGASHTHSPDEEPHQDPSWGYLQVGRTLVAFDAERQRLKWILIGGLPLALGLTAISSWWLSGLAMRPIYQSYQQQQQFTANAAHELRSPLASLLATVEAILRVRPDSKDLDTMLRTIERQSRRLSHLISDLLLLAILEQREQQPFQPCSLNTLVQDLTEEFAELASAAKIKLSCQISDRSIVVLGHESQLYRLVSNLIANGIQYTPEGGKVTVLLESSEKLALLSVNDTGIGIDPVDQKQIFNRFYRVDRDRSRKTGGAGLGLAISQAIARIHRGKILLQSEIDQGSKLTIQLPLHK